MNLRFGSSPNCRLIAEDAGEVLSLAFSPDETLLAAGTSDGWITLYDVAAAESGRLEVRSRFHCGLEWFSRLAFHPSGAFLATAGEGPITLWSLPEAKVYRQMRGSDDEEVHSLVFSPSGEWLLEASDDEVVRLFAWQSGVIADEFDAGERNASITFHRDRETIAVACSWQGGSRVKFCRLQNGALAVLPDREIKRPFDVLSPAAFSPDGAFLAFGDRDMNVYSFPDLQPVHAFDYSGARLGAPPPGFLVERYWTNPVFTSSGLLACGAPQGAIFLWDVQTGKQVAALRGHRKAVLALDVQRRGTLLASSGFDNTVRLWDLPLETRAR